MDIKQKIKQLREDRRFTLAQVTDGTGIPGSTLSSYERGTLPPLDKLEILAKFYDVNISYFTDVNSNEIVENVRKKENSKPDLRDQIIADLKSDKEFLMKIINSKLFKDAPGQVNFLKGSSSSTRVIEMYPELTALKVANF